MKTLIAIFFIFAASLAQAAPRAVDSVDVNRYLGTWYQIAHNPLFFEGGNCACAKQVLTATQDPKTIEVFNSCNQGQIRGTATADDATSAKFTVHFPWVPFPGSYWIVGLDPEYRFAVVTDRWGYSLYILSKTPTLTDDLYAQAVAIAAGQVDTSRLVKTDQSTCSY